MRALLVLFVVAPLVGCRPADEAVSGAAESARPAPAVEGAVEEASDEARIVMLGDSLTAGLGVAAGEAYPALVGEALDEAGWPVRVINAGVSGDTTAGGRARIDWLLGQRPLLVVVALGANDGLRGLPVEQLEENLRAIIGASREAGARVLLLGMRVPPNYGEDYATRFAAVYPRLAEEFDLPLMPFMLETVGGLAQFNQADGIHPNPAGHRAIAADMMPYLERELRAALNASEDGDGRREAK